MASYRSTMVDVMELPPREAREQALDAAGHNVFNLDSSMVYIDLLTDSGTGTMSNAQWAALVQGDESYAGSTSFSRLQQAVQDVMGFEYVLPAHQGRGAENVLYGTLISDGDYVPGNTHFDTTRAHIVNSGGTAANFPRDMDTDDRFKGDMDIDTAREYIAGVGAENVPAIVLTITNNTMAGQPVSMANTAAVRELADEIDAALVIDACRFAENAYFVQQHEDGYGDTPIPDIAQEQLSYADAVTMSAKKDGIANIGGFTAMRDRELYEQARPRAILYEGFPTYGGMAGRDLEAVAVGLREAVTEQYLEHRVGQVEELGAMLAEANIPIVEPVGGHAVYIDAARFLPHIPRDQFPGQALVCELYREGGVRAVELGSFAFPDDTDQPEFVRLAVPRRTYHQEHLEHVVETVAAVHRRHETVTGLEIVDEPPMKEIRHFSAELRPVDGPRVRT